MDNGESSYRRFIQGDRDAFDELMEAYRDKLIFFISGYVGSAQTAQDIAMDTFVEILVHPSRFKFKSSFKTYLYSIARHKAADFLRRRREYPDNQAVTQASFPLCVQDQLERLEDADMLRRAMQRLPRDYMTAVYLTYFEQLEAEQAARVMGKSKKQLANLIYRGKQALRAELEKEGFCYEEQ